MLRIALPNKGRLSDDARELVADDGLEVRSLGARALSASLGGEFEAYRQQLAVTVHQKTLVRFRELAQAKAKELGAERAVRDALAKDLRQLETDKNVPFQGLAAGEMATE